MNHTDLIKELRALTSAGMSDCKSALQEANWDLQAAVDIIKVKGLNIADARAGRVASEGMVVVGSNADLSIRTLIECNCQTDFVSNSQEFQRFACAASAQLTQDAASNLPFDSVCERLETQRKQVVATTKENVVIRRWWVEEALSNNVYVFDYVHSNSKIGVLLTLQGINHCPCMAMPCPNADKLMSEPAFLTLGEELAMQIAAMNPLAVSVDRLSPEDVSHQRTIFETQLAEMNKPRGAWAKIIEGKTAKWHKEACLLEQESVIVPKSTVAQVIDQVGKKLGGEIKVVNFVRCQVGEGVAKKPSSDFVSEVEQLSGVHQHTAQGLPGSCPDCPKDL